MASERVESLQAAGGVEAGTVLVVEDDASHVALMRQAFARLPLGRRMGLQVAASLAEARERLAQAPLPDLVIVDLVLPDGRGTELLQGQRLPLVIMTSHGDEQVAVEAIKAGALDYVVKSGATLANLPRLVDRALREWGHIQERRQAEAALRATEQRLQHLISTSPAVIYSAEPDGDYRITFVSENLTALLGYDPLECVGQADWWRKNLHPDDAPQVLARMARLVEAGHQVQEYRFCHEEGGYRWVRDESRLVCDAQGNPLEMVGSWTDISERVAVEERLQGHNRNLALLNEASQALTATLSLPQVVERLLRAALEVTNAEGSSVWLWAEDRPGELICQGILQGDEYTAEPGLRVPAGHGIAGWVARGGRSTIVADTQRDERFFPGVDKEIDFRTTSLLSVPLRTRDQIHGTLQVVNKREGSFDEDDLSLVETLGASGAIAVENARLVEGLGHIVDDRTAEIMAEKEKSEAILSGAGDAIMMLDNGHKIRYINPAFTDLTGYTPEEVLGQEADAVGVRAPSAQVQGEIDDALARGEPWQGEMVGYRKDGRTYDAALTITPMRDSGGNLTGFVSTHRDISPFKELDRARQKFITHVSHQLRTPATNVKIYASLLRKAQAPEQVERYLDVLEEQSEQLSGLVQDLLEVTKLDSGNAVDPRQVVAPRELIEDLLVRYQGRAEQMGVTLVVQAAPRDLPAIKGDPIRLAQALGALIDNGLKFTPQGGEVVVHVGTRAGEQGGWVTLAVHDTGPGIPVEEQRRVFERFYRGQAAEARQLPGPGLGLSIAQEIVLAHNGRLTVESPAAVRRARGAAEAPQSPNGALEAPEAAGPGSSFTIWLPVGS